MTISARKLFVNGLTFSRVPFITVFLVSAVYGEMTRSYVAAVIACAFMLLAGLSDLYDGMLARKWKVVSNFGKMADPLMDKVFFIVTFPTLLWLASVRSDNYVHATMLLVFTICWILRDQWVTFLRSVASSYGADVAAMWLGKVRTALSFPAAGIIYVYLVFRTLVPSDYAELALYCVYAIEIFLIGLNFYSFIAYTRVYMPYIRKALAPPSTSSRRYKLVN